MRYGVLKSLGWGPILRHDGTAGRSPPMLKKIPVEELRLGMHLHEMCGAWLDHPFWRTKFILRDPADLEKLRTSSVTEVWIDVVKGRDVASVSNGTHS